MTFKYAAWLGLGGNIGDPRTAMAKALRLLDRSEKCEITAVSPLYETPPWGKTDQPAFLNACAGIATDLEAAPLLDLCLSIERDMKRMRSERWGPRTLDIDVLVHSGGPVNNDGLQIPHPRMTERAFVMGPLADIAPDLTVEGKTASEWSRTLELQDLKVVAGPKWWR